MECIENTVPHQRPVVLGAGCGQWATQVMPSGHAVENDGEYCTLCSTQVKLLSDSTMIMKLLCTLIWQDPLKAEECFRKFDTMPRNSLLEQKVRRVSSYNTLI